MVSPDLLSFCRVIRVLMASRSTRKGTWLQSFKCPALFDKNQNATKTMGLVNYFVSKQIAGEVLTGYIHVSSFKSLWVLRHIEMDHVVSTFHHE
jgi:hypothetical protein